MNWYIYFAKTLGQSFPCTRRFHWCVENSDLKCLHNRYVSSLYGSIFSFLFTFFFIFWTKFKFLYVCTQFWLVSRLFHAYCELTRFKKLVLVTKWKKFMFFYKQHFFKLGMVGHQLMRQKNTWKLLNFLASK